MQRDRQRKRRQTETDIKAQADAGDKRKKIDGRTEKRETDVGSKTERESHRPIEDVLACERCQLSS